MLTTPVASKFAGTFHTDQSSLALAVQLLELRYSQYNPRMNFNYDYLDKKLAKLLPLEEVCVPTTMVRYGLRTTDGHVKG